MPNCCVPMCKNSSAKGFLLKCFPKNIKRRAQWLKNINRLNWSPNHSHRVCEAHFAPHMWEKTRVDGSRKLKFNAVPTIFENRILEDSSVIQDMDSHIKNNNEDNEASLKNVLSNNQTIIKILPPTSSINSQSSPIIISAASILKNQCIDPTSAIIVNSQGKIINSSSNPIISGTTSILKPKVKMTNAQSSAMIISTNASILKSQIKTANSQTPIIIPANSSILKTQMQSSSSQVNSVNFLKTTKANTSNSQSVLIPSATNIVKSDIQSSTLQMTPIAINTTNILKSQINHGNAELLKSKSSVNSLDEGCESKTNQQKTSLLKPTGIILNKAQAKKIEDERFEKMDKLLLKQLRLNNALRRKLNLMSHKMQQLMKEQNSDYKAFLSDVFTEDQIRALELRHTNPKSITAWSHKTMMKAIKLKQECGTRGYEELLKQNMPLPSIRTISRWCTARNIPIP